MGVATTTGGQFSLSTAAAALRVDLARRSPSIGVTGASLAMACCPTLPRARAPLEPPPALLQISNFKRSTLLNSKQIPKKTRKET
jgi:hypothetical protein